MRWNSNAADVVEVQHRPRGAGVGAPTSVLRHAHPRWSARHTRRPQWVFDLQRTIDNRDAGQGRGQHRSLRQQVSNVRCRVVQGKPSFFTRFDECGRSSGEPLLRLIIPASEQSKRAWLMRKGVDGSWFLICMRDV